MVKSYLSKCLSRNARSSEVTDMYVGMLAVNRIGKVSVSDPRSRCRDVIDVGFL